MELFLLYKSVLRIDEKRKYIVTQVHSRSELDLMIEISMCTPLLITESLEVAVHARDELNNSEKS